MIFTYLIVLITNFLDVVISNFSVEVHSILFTNDNIMLLLKWTVLLSRIYYQHLLQNVSILVVPDPEVTMTHIGNLSVQLTLQYNRQYSVNITQPGICGQPSKISFMELNFSKFLTVEVMDDYVCRMSLFY